MPWISNLRFVSNNWICIQKLYRNSNWLEFKLFKCDLNSAVAQNVVVIKCSWMKLIETFIPAKLADPDIFSLRSSQLNNSFLISFIWKLQFNATAIKQGEKIAFEVWGWEKLFKKELKNTQRWSTRQEVAPSAVEKDENT